MQGEEQGEGEGDRPFTCNCSCQSLWLAIRAKARLAVLVLVAVLPLDHPQDELLLALALALGLQVQIPAHPAVNVWPWRRRKLNLTWQRLVQCLLLFLSLPSQPPPWLHHQRHGRALAPAGPPEQRVLLFSYQATSGGLVVMLLSLFMPPLRWLR